MQYNATSSSKLGPAENRQRVTAIVLLIAIGLNAVIAGALLMADPTGERMGLSAEYLQYSPFVDFLIPGLVLFVCNDVLALFVAGLAILRNRTYPFMVFMQGCILCGWIVLQMIMVHSINMLQLACLAIGAALIIIGQNLLIRATRRRRLAY